MYTRRYAFAEDVPHDAGNHGSGNGGNGSSGSGSGSGNGSGSGGAPPCWLRAFGEWTDAMPCVEPLHRPANFRRR